MNQLYCGDNLEVLRRYVGDGSVDLIYLDPPFQSGRDYNILFEVRRQASQSAHARAFTDRWCWGPEAEETYAVLVAADNPLAKAMRALKALLGASDIMAYLCMMAVRLHELRKKLKPSGSLYLHCDPTASHYLKLILDVVFGAGCFRNEIIWRYRRWPARAKRYQRMHDVILYYVARQDHEAVFNVLYGYERLAESTLKTFGNRKQKADFSSGRRKPSVEAVETPGPPLSDVWDVSIIAPIGRERTGYPTQKPEALLERVIRASTNEEQVVLDPFCGCGTTIAVAQRLRRKWIGIDISPAALELIRERVDEAAYRLTKSAPSSTKRGASCDQISAV